MLRDLFNRLFGKQNPSDLGAEQITRPSAEMIASMQPPPAFEPTPVEEVQTWIHSQIERNVANGFLTREEILQSARDCFMDEMPEEEIEAFAGSVIDSVIEQHRVEQAGWPETTDCDRLDAAFRSLEEKGVIARQNFSCCGSCGSYEIWDEVAEAERCGVAARGYAFFHQQDTEGAVEGSRLYLNFGAKEEGEDAAIAIGREIQRELEDHGLTTNWDGSLARRIGVSLDWKRRTLTS